MTMMRKTITIPGAMWDWVRARIESGRYGNDSEYFRDLIRRDQEKRPAAHELRALIREGLDSGVSNKTIQDIMREIEDRLGQNEEIPTNE